MKRLFWTATIYVIVMIVALFAFMRLSKGFNYERRDIIYYNDLLYAIGDEYMSGVSEEEIERKYDCKLVLSKEINNEELAKIYSTNSFVLDFAPGGDYIGKVAWEDSLDHYTHTRQEVTKLFLIMWSVIFLAGVIVIASLYLSFVRPVAHLKYYAEQIAKGNLDEPVPIHRNNLFGAFLEAIDIMRIELKESRQKEIDAEKARKELVTQLSHDIKTPISIIKATCELMEAKIKRRRDTGDNAEDYEDALDKIGTITRKSQTVTDIMNNVMHATIEELEDIDVNVKEEDSRYIEEYFKSIRGYGNIVLKNSITPCLIMMDRLRTEQVIDNVVGNSYKYAGTDIEVSFSELKDVLMGDGTRGEFIRTTIRDSGPGASEDDLALLAEKYYRGSNAKESNGYGLGLYLVKWYMDKQGGGMEYYNDNGFVVELLLKKV